MQQAQLGPSLQHPGGTCGAPCTEDGTAALLPRMERRRRDTLNLSATLRSSWSTIRWLLLQQGQARRISTQDGRLDRRRRRWRLAAAA